MTPLFGPLVPDALDSLLCSVLWRTRAEVMRLVKQHDLGIKAIEIDERLPHEVGGPSTSVDRAAQIKILGLLEMLVPHFGRRAEEFDVDIPPAAGFTEPPVTIIVDPLDGTARFAWLMKGCFDRRDGVSIMLAVQLGAEVVAAYILDVFSGELYRVPPGRKAVLRSVREEDDLFAEPIKIRPNTLAKGTLVLNCEERFHGPLMALLEQQGRSRIFGNITVVQSGVGSSLLHILSGEAVALARRPGGRFTLWDDAPLIGFCRAADICTFAVMDEGLQEVALKVPRVPTRRLHNLLYVPRRYIDELAGNVAVRWLSDS